MEDVQRVGLGWRGPRTDRNHLAATRTVNEAHGKPIHRTKHA
jgi:hypothetical protein